MKFLDFVVNNVILFKKPKIENDAWKKSEISRKFPSYRNEHFVTTQSWLTGKQLDDEAEGLWRIYDDLYDLSDFVSQHPGGAFWLERTKGTDITEAFETHHIRGVPQTLLDKYKVRKAARPRNYTLTLNENGFYRTLKRRIAEKVQHLDYGPKRKTFYYHIGLLIAVPLFCVISTRSQYLTFEILAGLSLAWLSNAVHNYFHQRDNWQMYTFNLSLLNFTEFRISHTLSHHHYTNSLYDLEMSLVEPFLCWVPNDEIASKNRRILMALLQPIIYTGLTPMQFSLRLIRSIFSRNELFWHDLIPFTLPLIMVISSPASPYSAIFQWVRIICISSFIFGFIGLNAGHHSPENCHDGDKIRNDRDWGLYQLDACIERSDINRSQFLVLTHYGDHVLHHLFPTLDHGVLPQLYPIFWETIKEFKGELREETAVYNIIGQNRQLLRTKANTISPCERKKSN